MKKMTAVELEQLMQWYPMITQLPSGLLTQFMAEVRVLRVSVGTTLFDLDYPCTAFILLGAGAIRVTKPALSGREILLYRVEPGDSCILTVSCLLGNAAYPARGVAESDLVAYAIGHPFFSHLMGSSNAFREFVFRCFSERMTHLMALVEEVAFRQLDQRLAALLVERGPIIQATHQMVADEVGSAREVVSRILKHFEDLGYVRLERGRILIIQVGALAHYASAPR